METHISTSTSAPARVVRRLVHAREGHGPLLQRDYWAIITGCAVKASDVGELLARHFCDLAPPSLAQFCRTGAIERPLEVGDELEVTIRFAGTCWVRVLHRDANSLTVGTLEGHPEAGRITFGAYRHRSGGLVFHIRSRARSSDLIRYAGFVALGEAMQTNTWTRFIDNLARLIGGRVADYIYEETAECADEAPEADDQPTYLARGD